LPTNAIAALVGTFTCPRPESRHDAYLCDRSYVIGDVHGCHREFERLLDLCSDHANGKPARLITLGDYVGRGPDSFGVVQLIRYRLAGDYPGFKSIINLKGNHEDMMVHTVLGSEPRLKQNWVGSNNGGEATVESYPNREVLLDDAKWLGALPTSWEDKLRYYVHAGIRPGIPLKEQSETDKLWIRDLFLKHQAPHEKYVVHGHTSVRKPDVQPNRINVDTGLVFGGRLTAAVFDDSQVEAVDLFQVKANSLEGCPLS
jgi:serine/threonine protein phosphatase 1